MKNQWKSMKINEKWLAAMPWHFVSTPDPEFFVPSQVNDHIRSQEASPWWNFMSTHRFQTDFFPSWIFFHQIGELCLPHPQGWPHTVCTAWAWAIENNILAACSNYSFSDWAFVAGSHLSNRIWWESAKPLTQCHFSQPLDGVWTLFIVTFHYVPKWYPNSRRREMCAHSTWN